MSWQEKIKNSIFITTGDGVKYEFKLWIEPSQEIEWNATEFDYINIPGTDVDKQNVRGRKFPLRLFLQGDDHLDQAERFRLSLNDKRFCILDHPYYGLINVQILSLKINNADLNISEFTGTAIETITDTTPITDIPAIDYIELKKIDLDALAENELTVIPTITETNTLKMSINQNYNAGLKIATIPEQAQDYFNAFSTASNAVDVITASPILAMRTVIAMITLPAKFEATVKSRIQTLLNQFSYLRRTVIGTGNNIIVTSKAAKQLYTIQGLTLISSMAIAAVTGNNRTGNRDYTNANSVLEIIDIIKNSYETFLSDLGLMQSANNGSPSSYIPGYTSVFVFTQLISATIANLIDIALNGKREISVILLEDSNIILLTYKYYGLDAAGTNIQAFVDNNSLTWRDTLIIKKGREIFYYV